MATAEEVSSWRIGSRIFMILLLFACWVRGTFRRFEDLTLLRFLTTLL